MIPLPVIGQYQLSNICSTYQATGATAKPLDARATVPWWGGAEVTLGRVLVHMTAETQRHAGHADIVRELVDGSVGLLRQSGNMGPGDQAWWQGYRDQVERAARAHGRAGGQ